MSDLTRAEVIKHLEFLKLAGQIDAKPEKINPDYLQFAIDSLKTDETYQIEYENRDFIEIPEGATNGDVIRSVFPKAYIEEDREDTECVFTNINHGITFDVDWWDEPYRKEQE